MKRTLVLALVAALALAHLGAAGSRVYKQKEFAVRSRSAAGAIFLTKEGKRRFICSGTSIGHTENGDDLFLTARHCVYEDANPEQGTPAGFLGSEEVSFSDNEKGPFYVAVPYKISSTDDIAILEVINGKGLPTVRLGDENLTRPGSLLTNYTYALDFGKMPIEIKSVAPVFAHLPVDLISSFPVWAHSMPIDGMVAPGSSGSGLFDPKQRSLVGVAVGGVTGYSLGIAIPVSRVWKLLSDPIQDFSPKPALTEIPVAEFAAQFGKAHAFKLVTQPGNFQFTQGGYVFKVDTLGAGLSPKYYFDVPVYIDVTAPGEYRLYTTAEEGYSVDITLVSKAG